MTARMDWSKLLSTVRLGREADAPSTDVRSEFQRDFDRIVYSSAFRRMQDKTQVFPLAESDYVRTRLTHSLEVSCVGRSLGTLTGAFAAELEEGELPAASEFGNVVTAACLAHDIGNPGADGDASIDWSFFQYNFGPGDSCAVCGRHHRGVYPNVPFSAVCC